jgi:hypothetical protein
MMMPKRIEKRRENSSSADNERKETRKSFHPDERHAYNQGYKGAFGNSCPV